MENTKKDVQVELVKLDLASVIEKMNGYAAMRLKRVEKKMMEGLTPEDFVQNTLLKVLEGTYNWRTASTQDITKFLFGCLQSECSNFLKKTGRKKYSIGSMDEESDTFRADGHNKVADTKDYKFVSKSNLHVKGYNNPDWDELHDKRIKKISK